MQLIASSKKYDLEVHAQFDIDAGIWELFSERDAECYIGCADNIQDARAIAKDWIADRASI